MCFSKDSFRRAARTFNSVPRLKAAALHCVCRSCPVLWRCVWTLFSERCERSGRGRRLQGIWRTRWVMQTVYQMVCCWSLVS